MFRSAFFVERLRVGNAASRCWMFGALFSAANAILEASSVIKCKTVELYLNAEVSFAATNRKIDNPAEIYPLNFHSPLGRDKKPANGSLRLAILT